MLPHFEVAHIISICTKPEVASDVISGMKDMGNKIYHMAKATVFAHWTSKQLTKDWAKLQIIHLPYEGNTTLPGLQKDQHNKPSDKILVRIVIIKLNTNTYQLWE